MQKLFVLFIFVQFSVANTALAQRGSAKASDACPGSNENKRTSKEYAALSTRSASDNDFSKPRYQSIYAKKPALSTELKRGKAVANGTKTVPEKQTAKTQPLVEKKTAEIPGGSATPAETKQQPVTEEAEFEIPTPSKPYDVIPSDKPLPPVNESTPVVKELTPAASETGTAAVSKSTTTPSGKQKTSKAADQSKTKAAKEKARQKACVKKPRFGKRNATDCPEF